MNSKPILNNGLRSASEPYTIPLDNNDYGLAQKIVNQHVDAKIKRRKDWQGVKLLFLGLGADVLRLAVISLREKFELSIKIEKDHLNVSCSCGQLVEKLCSHAYAALLNMSHSGFDSGILRKYLPDGPVALALKYRKHFSARFTGLRPEVKQNTDLGAIYRFSSTNIESDLTNVLKLQGSPAPTGEASAETTLSYFLMYATWHTLPFLMPAEALLNQAGNEVNGFVRYIQYTDDLMAKGQAAIFQKCAQLKTLVKQLPGTIRKAAERHGAELTEVFQLWEELLPLVRHQPFVFKTRHWMWQTLKLKPPKMESYPIKISAYVPEVQFELIDKRDYYCLQLHILINGAKLLKYSAHRVLIFDKDRAYLLGSLRDAALIELMQDLGGHLTIFKEHFEDFEEQVLLKLGEAYFVKNYSENH